MKISKAILKEGGKLPLQLPLFFYGYIIHDLNLAQWITNIGFKIPHTGDTDSLNVVV